MYISYGEKYARVATVKFYSVSNDVHTCYLASLTNMVRFCFSTTYIITKHIEGTLFPPYEGDVS